MEDTRCLKNRVRELRKRLGLRQSDLAAQIGVTRQTILAIEKERLNPSVLISLKIARILREPVDYVFYLAPAAVQEEPSAQAGPEPEGEGYVSLEPPKAPARPHAARALVEVPTEQEGSEDLNAAPGTKDTKGPEPSKNDSDDEPPNQAIWEFV